VLAVYFLTQQMPVNPLEISHSVGTGSIALTFCVTSRVMVWRPLALGYPHDLQLHDFKGACGITKGF
jgi:hypothetical protein